MICNFFNRLFSKYIHNITIIVTIGSDEINVPILSLLLISDTNAMMNAVVKYLVRIKVI